LIFTMLEGFAWAEGFNFLEHLAILICGVSLAAWIVNPHPVPTRLRA